MPENNEAVTGTAPSAGDFIAALRGMSAEQIDEVACEVGRLQSSTVVVEAAEYDQHQRLPLVVSIPSVDRIWYCEKKEDANHNNLIWKSGGIVKVMGKEKLDSITKESDQLKTDDGLGINAERLIQLLGSSPERDPWRKKAAVMASIQQPIFNGVGEMFLQQTVYSSIAELCFSIDPKRYAADQDVKCSHIVQSKGGELLSVMCQPDAASKATATYYVVAMMELKALDVIDHFDVAKCVLMTAMSALAFQAAGIPMDLSIAIPFVIGSNEKAWLFATYLEQGRPRIELVYDADFFEQKQKIEFFARLAVLVAKLAKLLDGHRHKLRYFDLLQFPGKAPNVLTSKRSGGGPQRSDPSKKNKCKTSGGASSAGAAEKDAMAVAACHGRVTDLKFPWFRYRTLDLNDQATWKAEMAYYQQESPFYFKGHIVGDKAGSVFCKTWREGDYKTDRRTIKNEIELLGEANSHGVPSPMIVEDLTAMDIVYPSSPSLKFHVLIMSELPNDVVEKDDIHNYALSLIHTVRRLHSSGILHCDLKPNNIVWDAKRKVAALVDFGHAQKIVNSKAYGATEGYEAPEIIRERPHTCETDAYSLGRTLMEIIKSVEGRSDEQESMIKGNIESGDALVAVKEVAAKLSLESPSQRMTLEEAESTLTYSGTLPPRKRFCVTPSTGDLLSSVSDKYCWNRRCRQCDDKDD